MSIFKPVNIESDIEILKKRESIIKDYKERLGNQFVMMIWDDPDDPFCCTGHPVFRSIREDQGIGIVYGSYIPTTVTPCIRNV